MSQTQKPGVHQYNYELEDILASLGQARKKILIMDPFNACPALDMGLEIAARLAHLGHCVNYTHYGACLPYSEMYKPRRKRVFRLYGYKLSPHLRGISRLTAYSRGHKLSLRCEAVNHFDLPNNFDLDLSYLSSLSVLKSLKFRGSNMMGISVASSLISATRDPRVSPVINQQLCIRLIESFCMSYYLAIERMSANAVDALVICNGRFACTKGCVQAANELKIPVFFYERGSSPYRFSFAPFHPHDRLAIQSEIVKTWNKAYDDPKRVRKAQLFFQERRSGLDQGWMSYTKEQSRADSHTPIQNALKSSRSGKIIVYFSSSDDEYLAVDDFYSMNSFSWSNQRDALAVLARVAEACGHSLVVRVHPNIQSAASSERTDWNNLTFLPQKEHITIVPSHSSASSYALLDAASLVVTYGSTMGIESVFWGKPSVLLGDSTYDSIEASVAKITSEAALYDYLRDPGKWIVDSQTAESYGYYMATFGIKHRLYQPFSLFQGKFLGLNLQHYHKSPFHRLGEIAMLVANSFS